MNKHCRVKNIFLLDYSTVTRNAESPLAGTAINTCF